MGSFVYHRVLQTKFGVWLTLGQPPHVANLKQHFPGAPLKQSAAQKMGIKMSTATGDLFDNLGECDVPVHTEEGRHYSTTFQNAKVSTPILSTGRMADSECIATFQKDGGTTLHEPSGAISSVIRCYGVYRVTRLVGPKLLNTRSPF